MDLTHLSERALLEKFLDDERAAFAATVEGLSDEQARRRLVPSLTTPLGLVKHLTFVEQAWFEVTLAGRTRAELGLPEDVDSSFAVEPDDTVASALATYYRVCEQSRRTAAGYELDHVAEHRRLGRLSLRWIHLHLIREIARHSGHADILREQILAPPG